MVGTSLGLAVGAGSDWCLSLLSVGVCFAVWRREDQSLAYFSYCNILGFNPGGGASDGEYPVAMLSHISGNLYTQSYTEFTCLLN